MKDEEIVLLIQKGEVDKFGLIIDHYQQKLFWYIKRLINQRDEEVEDLVAEVMIAAYQNLLGFDTKKKFSSWIYRIAHNKAVDFIKRKKNKTVDIEDFEELLSDNKKLMEEVEIEKEEKKKVREAINKLELNYKEVIMLYYFEEKNYEEISDILKIPVNNVGVMLFRARKRLKKIYDL